MTMGSETADASSNVTLTVPCSRWRPSAESLCAPVGFS